MCGCEVFGFKAVIVLIFTVEVWLVWLIELWCRSYYMVTDMWSLYKTQMSMKFSWLTIIKSMMSNWVKNIWMPCYKKEKNSWVARLCGWCLNCSCRTLTLPFYPYNSSVIRKELNHCHSGTELKESNKIHSVVKRVNSLMGASLWLTWCTVYHVPQPLRPFAACHLSSIHVSKISVDISELI